MSKGKVAKWINNNIVMLICIPLIIGIHYGWSKLQDVPYLVDQSKPKEMPVLAAFHAIRTKISEELNHEGSSSKDTQEK